MKTFYFSGIEKKATAQVLGNTQAAGMMSQLQYSPALLAACDECNISDLVMDSGAYTKELTDVDIADYAKLITHLGTRCTWYANADKIGDQAQTNRNYDYLLSLLPTYLHERILWIYSYGADLDYLYEGLRNHRRVGIGGLVPMLKALDKSVAYQAIRELIKIVATYDVESHWLGVSTLGIIDMFHQELANFSVDSTTWLLGGRYGLLVDSQGRQRPAAEGGYDFSTSAILEQNVRTMRKWVEQPVKKTTNKPYTQLSFLDVA